MNKEEIEEIKRLLFQDRLTQYGKRKLVQYLEQKESILDKVTEYCKRFEYETEPIEDDDYLSERALVCEDILEIIEGEKKNGK